MRLDIVAAVNDDAVLAANLLRSPLVAQGAAALFVQRGYASAGRAFNAALVRCTADVVVIVHQDVYLPAGWERQVEAAIARLERIDPAWAVLGLYGVTAAGRQVGCVWSSGLEALCGARFDEPVRVDSLDEVLLVLRRGAALAFDDALPGFHLYATDLVQTAQARGLSTYAICAPVVHNSRPAPFLGDDYFRAYRYVARKWSARLPIDNNVAPLLHPGPSYAALRARHKLRQLAQWPRGGGRIDRGLDCVAIARELELE